MKRFFRYTAVIAGVFALLAAALFYLLSRPETTAYVSEKVLKPQGVSYREIEGSALEGYTVYDLNISERFFAKKAEIKYRLGSLVSIEPTIERVVISGGVITFAGDEEPSQEESGVFFPGIGVKYLELSDVRLQSDVSLVFEMKAKNTLFRSGKLSIGQLEGSVRSEDYGTLRLEGKVNKNVYSGAAWLSPSSSLRSEYLSFADDFPKVLALSKVNADARILTFESAIGTLSPGALRFDDLKLSFACELQARYCHVDAGFALAGEGFHAKVAQKALISAVGAYATEADMNVTSELLGAPVRIQAEAGGDLDAVYATLRSEGVELKAHSFDYNRFLVALSAAKIPEALAVPEALRDTRISAHGSVQLLPVLSVEAEMEAENPYARITAKSSYAGALYADMLITPHAYKILAQLPVSLRAPLHAKLYAEENETILYGESEALTLTLHRFGEAVEGWGALLGSSYEFNGTMPGDMPVELQIKTHTPSVMELAARLDPKQLPQSGFYDAEVATQNTLRFAEAMQVESNISVPWYAVVPDSQRAYYGNDSNLSLHYEPGRIVLEHYAINLFNHALYSNRPSVIVLGDDLQISSDAIWIFDNLKLSAKAVLSEGNVTLRLQSSGFEYRSAEGKATVATDIQIVYLAGQSGSVEGWVNVKEAMIDHLPFRGLSVSDEDIIIIQDIRPPSREKWTLNLRIFSEGELHYRSEGLTLSARPDVTLWKSADEPLVILGMVKLLEGSLTQSGKLFAIEPGQLYFAGAHPVNPYLELLLSHEVIEKHFEIFVTHTLDDPVFLFSSDPPMNQNDIMSYILFGGSSSDVFDRNADEGPNAANLILGSGLKTIVGEVTGVKIDTVNILSGAEGISGIEVGARLHEKLRVMYKNDAISSLLLQYSLSRSLRIDIDIHETGQGVNFIYIKDYGDWLQ